MSAIDPVAYLDSSALVKLVVEEQESAALRAFLGGYRQVSSMLAVTELLRAVGRWDDSQIDAGKALLARVALVEVTRPVLDRAAVLLPRSLRTLDAIHVSSALALEGALAVFVTYDSRLREAAEASGLPIATPG